MDRAHRIVSLSIPEVEWYALVMAQCTFVVRHPKLLLYPQGQKKPVQVFRFVTEGTIEEKIIERADRKLFLDAAVVQQGRLAEQNNSLEKDELMKMVRFGADQILSGQGGTYTDEDIDALIARGEERTEAMQAKLQTDAKHNLASFSLLADDDAGMDTFAFGGKNYRDSDKGVGNFINLPQRQRKRNYDVNEYFRDAMHPGGNTSGAKAGAADAGSKKRKKGPATFQDFQLFEQERLNAIYEKERDLAAKKDAHLEAIRQIRESAKHAPTLGSGVAPGKSREELRKVANEMEQTLSEFHLKPEDEELKKTLLADGFADWNRKDFKVFCNALEKHGRYDFASISRDVIAETNKTLDEVRRYFVAFWTKYRLIGDWKKIIERVEKGEKKILRLRMIRDAIQDKVERHIEDVFGPNLDKLVQQGEDGKKKLPSYFELIESSWPSMRINYGNTPRGRSYQEEEDAFLLCMMYRHGFGAAERIRMEIRYAWQFRFDW